MIIFVSHIVLPRGKTGKTKAISLANVWNPNFNGHYSEPNRYFLSRFYYIQIKYRHKQIKSRMSKGDGDDNKQLKCDIFIWKFLEHDATRNQDLI